MPLPFAQTNLIIAQSDSVQQTWLAIRRCRRKTISQSQGIQSRQDAAVNGISL